MGLIEDLKTQVKKSGSNKGKILYLKAGNKIRVRFLQELDTGYKVLFHDSFEAGINVPCQELYDRECINHDAENLAHRDNYVWSVWDHEAKDVKLLLGRVNNCSPIPQIVAMYDTYETIMDRDYVITKNGTGTTTSFSVVPMDKSKFKNEKAKAYSESKVMDILDKAFPSDDEGDDDKPKSKKKNADIRKKNKKYDDDEDDEDDEDEDDEEEKPVKKKKKKIVDDYEDMTAKELYLECVERGIHVRSKRSEDYYITKLEDDDDER